MTSAQRAQSPLQQRLEAAMHDAMRARDGLRTQTLRMAMAAAHNKGIELGRALDDGDLIEVIGRQIKQRRESIEVYRAAGREEQAGREEAEAAILLEFMPAQLDQAELARMVDEAVAATGASGPRDMGAVMGRLAPQTKGRADGRQVSDLVRTVLAERAGRTA